MSEMFRETERRRAEIERHRENRGRPAMAYGRFSTTGLGTYQFRERIDFGLTFIEEPYMSYGCYIDPDSVDEAIDLAFDDVDAQRPAFPLCCGYVTEWDLDEKGYYVGAWVAASIYPVELLGEGGSIPADVTHYYTFAAVGLKTFPEPPDDDVDGI